jgi:hypothetical protein
MKIGAMLLLAFLVSSPAWALSCPRGDESPQISYDNADVVALVRLIGEPRDNGLSGEFEVIRSWKATLPKRINIMESPPRVGHSVGTCAYYFKYEGRYILYLTREEDGTFSTGYGPLNLHEFEGAGTANRSSFKPNGRIAFHHRLRELENAAQCGCGGYEQGSFDTESLRKRADVIADAYVKRTWRKGTASYAELKLVSQDEEKKYNDPFSAKWPSLIVVTEDGDPDCGYPVIVEPGVEIENEDNVKSIDFYHRFYLHYDRDTEKKHSITGYSTNICSGNKPIRRDSFRWK